MKLIYYGHDAAVYFADDVTPTTPHRKRAIIILYDDGREVAKHVPFMFANNIELIAKDVIRIIDEDLLSTVIDVANGKVLDREALPIDSDECYERLVATQKIEAACVRENNDPIDTNDSGHIIAATTTANPSIPPKRCRHRGRSNTRRFTKLSETASSCILVGNQE